MKKKAKVNSGAVIYCRKSSDKQDVTLFDQEERLRAYCLAKGLDVVESNSSFIIPFSSCIPSRLVFIRVHSWFGSPLVAALLYKLLCAPCVPCGQDTILFT